MSDGRRKTAPEETCKRPDRHVPSIVCGFPLPCMWHTVTIDLTEQPPCVCKPVTAHVSPTSMKRIDDIASALAEPCVDVCPSCGRPR